ncbi:AGAP012426-PA [Sergentomyia squamirostris]
MMANVGNTSTHPDEYWSLIEGGWPCDPNNDTHPFFCGFTDEYCLNHYENITYLNVSCEIVLDYGIPLYGYCTPFLLFITMTANLLIVIVLSRRSMATPTNMVLMGESGMKDKKKHCNP